jgi:hypothetical protein
MKVKKTWPHHGGTKMKKRVFILMIIWFALNCAGAEIKSLSDVFYLGKGILDQDEDGFADRIALCIVIPDEASAFEIAAASDIAARANFDSLVVDFSLVKKESEFDKISWKKIGESSHCSLTTCEAALYWRQALMRRYCTLPGNFSSAGHTCGKFGDVRKAILISLWRMTSTFFLMPNSCPVRK